MNIENELAPNYARYYKGYINSREVCIEEGRDNDGRYHYKIHPNTLEEREATIEEIRNVTGVNPTGYKKEINDRFNTKKNI